MSAWANRRAAVQAEADAMAAAKDDVQRAALAEKPESEVLLELDLPNPDEMQQGDDFSAFMKANVPAALRNRALKQLWASNPLLANVDSLVDYGEDFTGKNEPVKLIKTVYRVGKGMLPDKEDLPDAAPELVPEPTAEEIAADEVEVFVPAEVPEPLPEAPPYSTPRRRMRFEFGAGEMTAPAEMEKQ